MRLRGSGKRANPSEDQMDEWRLLADQFGLPYYMIHERYLAPGEPVDHERMVCTRFLKKYCAKARQNTCNRIHWTECQLSRVMLQQGYLNADVSREIIKYGVRSTGESMALSRANKLPDWFTESSHWMDFYDYLLAEDPAARTTHNDLLPDSEDALDLLLHARRQDLADRASGSSIQPVCKKRPKFLQPTPKSRTKTAKTVDQGPEEDLVIRKRAATTLMEKVKALQHFPAAGSREIGHRLHNRRLCDWSAIGSAMYS